MHEYIHHIEHIIASGEATPLIVALLMGILVATNPCPLATNVSAILYFARETPQHPTFLYRTLLFGLGRLVAYMLVGVVSVLLLRLGFQQLHLSESFLVYGEVIVGVLLIVIGAFFLVGHRLSIPHLHVKEKTTNKIFRGKNQFLAPFLLGMLLAVVFCPVTAVAFFGVMAPLAANQMGGLLYFFLFSLVSVLPVLVIYIFLHFGLSRARLLERRIVAFQRWFNIVVGIIFILFGSYLGVIHPLIHPHH